MTGLVKNRTATWRLPLWSQKTIYLH